MGVIEMDLSLPHLRIHMVRPTLAHLPQEPLPAPYWLRHYRPGDEAAWVHIHELADPLNKIAPELYRREFGSDERELRRRQLYLCDGAGAPIGTITAWHDAECPGGSRGRVHWVAIVPAFQGFGLGKPLMGSCLRLMVRLGCDSACLTTNPPRVPAINLYLRCGFLPDARSQEERDAWRLLAEKVRPEFRDAVAACAEDRP